MGVSGQILQQVMGAAEGCFGVDDPLFLAQGIQKSEKRWAAGQSRELAGENEFVGTEQPLEPIAHFGPEHRLQHGEWHEKVGSRVNPPRLVW